MTRTGRKEEERERKKQLKAKKSEEEELSGWKPANPRRRANTADAMPDMVTSTWNSCIPEAGELKIHERALRGVSAAKSTDYSSWGPGFGSLTVGNSSSRSNALFCLPRAPGMQVLHRQTRSQGTHTHK